MRVRETVFIKNDTTGCLNFVAYIIRKGDVAVSNREVQKDSSGGVVISEFYRSFFGSLTVILLPKMWMWMRSGRQWIKRSNGVRHYGKN